MCLAHVGRVTAERCGWALAFAWSSINQDPFVPLGTNPANAIKPSILLENIPMSPVLVAVTHLAARAEEKRQLRIARIQSTSIAAVDRSTHHLLLARGELPSSSTKTPDQNFANPYLNQPSGAAAHTAHEGMLSENFRSDVGIRVHFLSVRLTAHRPMQVIRSYSRAMKPPQRIGGRKPTANDFVAATPAAHSGRCVPDMGVNRRGESPLCVNTVVGLLITRGTMAQT